MTTKSALAQIQQIDQQYRRRLVVKRRQLLAVIPSKDIIELYTAHTPQTARWPGIPFLRQAILEHWSRKTHTDVVAILTRLLQTGE